MISLIGAVSLVKDRRQKVTLGENVIYKACKHRIWLTSASCATLLVAMAATPVVAQTAQNSLPEGQATPSEVIIVTARRVEENLQEVPLTIRVLKDAEIQREGVRNLNDVARLSAGVTYDLGGFPNDTRPAMRGMQSERGRPSVAIMLDGQDLSGENLSIAGGTAGIATDILDLERIEVVKGPQSTLYGRNAFAGAINYISKKPSFVFETRFSVEAATGGQIGVTGSFTGPLVEDKLAFRVNGAFRRSDGFWTNPVNGGPLGAEAMEGGSLALRFTPTPSLEFNGRYQTSHMDNSDYPTAFLFSNVRRPVPNGVYTLPPPPGPPGPPGVPIPCPATLAGLSAAATASCTRGAYVGAVRATIANVQMGVNEQTGAPPHGLETEQDVGQFDAKWTSGFGEFHYSFGYLKNTSDIEQDGDFTNFAPPPGPPTLSLSALNQLNYTNEHTDQDFYWTHEIGAFQVLLGGQIFSEESVLVNDSKFWLRSRTSPFAGPPFFLSTRQVTNRFPSTITRDTDYNAIFGSLKWQVTDALAVGIEARRNSDEITYSIPGWRLQDTSLFLLTPRCLPGFAQGATLQGPPLPGTVPPGVVIACPRTETLSYEETTPRFTIDYKLNSDILLYASAAKGFKPGGFNTNEVTELLGQSYLPEFVTAYEIGFKSKLFDRRLTLNADVYFNDYTDQQIGVQRNVAGNSGVIVATAGIINAGAVEAKGFELDANFQFNERLNISLGYAYTDSVFKEYIGGPRPGSPAAAFAACGVPNGQTSSDQTRADAGNVCADFSGNSVAKSPKNSVNASVLYEAPWGAGDNKWFVELSAQYRSKRFTDESNLTFMEAYTNLELVAGLEFDRVTWTAFVHNLTDDETVRVSQRNVDPGNPEGFVPGRGFTAYLLTPRVIGIRMNLKVN